MQAHELSAAQLARAYRRRELSPLEALDAVLAHMARWEPHLQATWALDATAARSAAQAATRRFERAEPRGPLDGVPCTLKENIATQGVAVPLGCAATALQPATADAPPAARLREAGAVIIAKTTMPDWGMLSSGLSSFHALTRNPWDLRLNPGGSSAGAGAAAAAGYGPLHLGTDIGGSIRLPAAWCGVFGFKPSGGRIPINPPFTGRVAGPMTRSVEDAALMMAALSQPDWRDATSLPYQDLAWADWDSPMGAHQASADQAGERPGATASQPLRGLRIGLHLDAGWGLAVEPAIAQAVQTAAQAFERAGAVIEPLAPFCTRAMADGMDAFWRTRSWLDLQALPTERQAQVLPYIRAWVGAAAGYSTAQVFQGYAQMAALRDAAVRATQPFDFVISPVSPVGTFPAEWAGPTNDPARPLEHIGFTLPYNMSEQPSCSIDAGRDARGMPIGLQITGRRHDDMGVLRLARLWEQLRGPQPPWPQPPGV